MFVIVMKHHPVARNFLMSTTVSFLLGLFDLSLLFLHNTQVICLFLCVWELFLPFGLKP